MEKTARYGKEGQLDEKRILEQGKEMLEKRLSSIERGLEITQFNLDNLNENQKYSHETRACLKKRERCAKSTK